MSSFAETRLDVLQLDVGGAGASGVGGLDLLGGEARPALDEEERNAPHAADGGPRGPTRPHGTHDRLRGEMGGRK